MRFTSFRFLWLLFLPLLFWNGVCNNANDENERNVVIFIRAGNAVKACDRIMVNNKNVKVTIGLFEYSDQSGSYDKLVQRMDIDKSNNWEDGFDYNFKLKLQKSYVVKVVATQECSFCCTVANAYFGCVEPPSALKDGSPSFYGETSIDEYGTMFITHLAVNSIRCAGC